MATKKVKEASAETTQVPAAPAAPAVPKAAKEPKAPKVPVEKAPLDEKNGVTRPSSGKTKKVWDVADAMSKAAKAPVTRAALTDALLAEGLVVGTIHTQYGKWRKYHGLVTVKEATPAAPVPPAAPVAPV